MDLLQADASASVVADSKGKNLDLVPIAAWAYLPCTRKPSGVENPTSVAGVAGTGCCIGFWNYISVASINGPTPHPLTALATNISARVAPCIIRNSSFVAAWGTSTHILSALKKSLTSAANAGLDSGCIKAVCSATYLHHSSCMGAPAAFL